jgi:ABC-type amino acid transport substrate-binding protein
MPSATLVAIRTKADLERILEDGGADFDAIGARSEEGAAWTILYPNFSLVVPQPPAFIRVGYAVAHDNVDLLHFVDAWLLAAKAHGTVDALYDYWMLGRTKTARPPRWSVIRDLLHWVD